jgi:hypothetical protein
MADFKQYPYTSHFTNPVVNGYPFFVPNLPGTANNEKYAYKEPLWLLDAAFITSTFTPDGNLLLIAQWSNEEPISLEFKALSKVDGQWKPDSKLLGEIEKAWTGKGNCAVLLILPSQKILYPLASILAHQKLTCDCDGLQLPTKGDVDEKLLKDGLDKYFTHQLRNELEPPSRKAIKNDEALTYVCNDLSIELLLNEYASGLPVDDVPLYSEIKLDLSKFDEVLKSQSKRSSSSGYKSKQLDPTEKLQWLEANAANIEKTLAQYGVKPTNRIKLMVGLSIVGVNQLPDIYEMGEDVTPDQHVPDDWESQLNADDIFKDDKERLAVVQLLKGNLPPLKELKEGLEEIRAKAELNVEPPDYTPLLNLSNF